VATMGDRPLGLEVAQLLAVAHWFKAASGQSQIRLETEGVRSQVVALMAAALEPTTFSHVVSGEAMRSLGYLIDTPIPFRAAPELFCLDLYKDFDLDRLVAIAAPTEIATIGYAVPPGTTGARH